MSALKNLLAGGQAVAYYPALARAVGGIAPALFVQQVAHWQGYSEDGWMYRTQEELEHELAMSVKVQQRCRKDLVDAGILEEQRRQPNARLYYRVNWHNLELALNSIPSGQSKPPNGTVSTSPKGHSNNKSKDKSKDKNSVGSQSDQDQKKGKAKPRVTQLVDLCRGVGFEPTNDQRTWWGAAINREVASGTSEKRIAEIMGIIEDKADDGVYCSWKQANKILDGDVKPYDKHEANAKEEATPQDGIARLEAHSELSGYAEIARRFDFSSTADPPWQVLNRLGGTSDEQHRNLTRIRSVVGTRAKKVDAEHERLQKENDRMLEEMWADERRKREKEDEEYRQMVEGILGNG